MFKGEDYSSFLINNKEYAIYSYSVKISASRNTELTIYSFEEPYIKEGDENIKIDIKIKDVIYCLYVNCLNKKDITTDTSKYPVKQYETQYILISDVSLTLPEIISQYQFLDPISQLEL